MVDYFCLGHKNVYQSSNFTQSAPNHGERTRREKVGVGRKKPRAGDGSRS